MSIPASASAGDTLMSLFIQYLLQQMKDAMEVDPAGNRKVELKAADLEVVRKLLADNSITLASVQRGDFGEMAQKVAEQFPFDEDAVPMGTA